MVEIVSDVGGTNCRFALLSAGTVEAASIRRYRNDDHGSYASALNRYLAAALDELGQDADHTGLYEMVNPAVKD